MGYPFDTSCCHIGTHEVHIWTVEHTFTIKKTELVVHLAQQNISTVTGNQFKYSNGSREGQEACIRMSAIFQRYRSFETLSKVLKYKSGVGIIGPE